MFLRIVSGYYHQRNTGNASAGIHPYSATHPQRRVNKMDYWVAFMCSSWWPAILQTIEKTSNENHV